MGMLGNVENGGKFPDDELLVLNVLPSVVWVDEEDGGFRCSEGDGPLTVVAHGLVGFGIGTTIDDELNVTQRLCVSDV